ncbi:MAG: QueT transporter family protein [Christensenellaceae bacterium]|jgi:uncharacterized membrane protein|nr:QueT transporter family protein [Christensenellaceae bacterium]
MNKNKLLIIVRAAVVAALYFVLTLLVAPVAFGPIQLRFGEALTILPVIFPESVLGLTLGCLLANVLSPYGWYDMLFGTMATLLASISTFLIGRVYKLKLTARIALGAIPPILVNAVVLPIIWYIFAGDVGYWVNFASILLSQALVILVVGIPLTMGLTKIPFVNMKNFSETQKVSESDTAAPHTK